MSAEVRPLRGVVTTSGAARFQVLKEGLVKDSTKGDLNMSLF